MQIPEFPDYYATRDGKIYSYKKGHNWKNWKYTEIKQRNNERGYSTIPIFRDGKQYSRKVHRLVWSAFNGTISEGLEINHINEIRDDNRLENLELLTHRENLMYGGRRQRHRESLKRWWREHKGKELP